MAEQFVALENVYIGEKLMLRISAFLCAFSVCILGQGGHHHEFRKLSCVKRDDGAGTDCTLTLKKKRDGDFKEFQATTNQGCFEEEHPNGRRVYCPLYCPETVDAYSVAKVPQDNHKCVNHITYKSEKRDDEWYLWRVGTCLEQEMSFEYGCHFTFPIDKADVESFFKKHRV